MLQYYVKVISLDIVLSCLHKSIAKRQIEATARRLRIAFDKLQLVCVSLPTHLPRIYWSDRIARFALYGGLREEFSIWDGKDLIMFRSRRIRPCSMVYETTSKHVFPRLDRCRSCPYHMTERELHSRFPPAIS